MHAPKRGLGGRNDALGRDFLLRSLLATEPYQLLLFYSGNALAAVVAVFRFAVDSFDNRASIFSTQTLWVKGQRF